MLAFHQFLIRIFRLIVMPVAQISKLLRILVIYLIKSAQFEPGGATL